MIRLWAVSVLAIGLMLPLSSNSVADDKQQARLDDLKRSISKLEKRLSVQDKEKNSLQSELKKVELETSQISRNLRSLRKKVAGLEVKLANKVVLLSIKFPAPINSAAKSPSNFYSIRKTHRK